MPDSVYDESASACDTESRSYREYYPAFPPGKVYAGHTFVDDGWTIGPSKSV